MVAATLALLCLSLAAPLARALTYKGADISSLTLLEKSGIKYTDDGTATPFETIIKNHGANSVRVRVWTTGDYDLNYGLALAKRVKAAGMTLVVDLHYSDTWADPAHQAIPAGWPTDLDGLNTQIWSYTQDVVNQFSAQGTPIDVLQVGNEINDGLLWPVGQISVNGLASVSQLLHSAIDGARTATGASAATKTLVHLANGWDWAALDAFFSGVFVPGALAETDVDLIGVSFYPFYDDRATFAALKTSLANAAAAWGKGLVVAETNWPASCPDGNVSEPTIPLSTSGQSTWTWDVKEVLNGLPDGLGQGIFYWEPGWVGNAALGSACADNLLVDSSGAARDSINIFSWDM